MYTASLLHMDIFCLKSHIPPAVSSLFIMYCTVPTLVYQRWNQSSTVAHDQSFVTYSFRLALAPGTGAQDLFAADFITPPVGACQYFGFTADG